MNSTPGSQSNEFLQRQIKTPLRSIQNQLSQEKPVRLGQPPSFANKSTLLVNSDLDTTLVDENENMPSAVSENKRKISTNLSWIDDIFDSEAPVLNKKHKKNTFLDSDSDNKANKTIKEPEIITLDSDEEPATRPKSKRKMFSRPKSDSEASEEESCQSQIVLTRSHKRAKPTRFVKEIQEVVDEEEEEEDEEIDDDEEIETRRKIRKIKDDDQLKKSTKAALKREQERIKRLERKKKAEAELNEDDFFLDYDPKTKQSNLKMNKYISSKLKPHQKEGIKFMWDSCYESLSMIQRKNSGAGCILAHCMGLGKTLQVIGLIHTLLSNSKLTKCNKVLILMPVNVISNWVTEINKWTAKCKNKIEIHQFSSSSTDQRLDALEEWDDLGGVFLMGYEMFANLIQGTSIKDKKNADKFKELILSTDLIICDEGHKLKNDQTKLVKSIVQVKTKRRIVLTGTPLQNNLEEYYCMTSFVRPNLLGTLKEFKNGFVNPITNGQHKDSTHEDVMIMKRRGFVLHRRLNGIVNRQDFSIIRAYLPPKNEYVISIRMKPLQIELYKMYLAKYRGIEDASASNLGNVSGKYIFKDFQQLCRVWTHPRLIKIHQELKAENELKKKENQQKRNNKKFKADNEYVANKENMPSTSNAVSIDLESFHYQEEVAENQDDHWYEDKLNEDCQSDLMLSGKLVLLDQILRKCDEVGDKLVVFSQSLPILDLIERYLKEQTKKKVAKWRRGIDYFRIDGSVDVETRTDLIDNFNDKSNTRGRLFLISTKAGGIGINLVAANRCIIFDSTWNPSYDSQSIFRIYRFGQEKEVFIYRFLSQGTMEEKIYMRQVSKTQLAQRVIDEHQLDRHFTYQELKELYSFYPDVYDENVEPLYAMPKDDVLKSLLLKNKNLIVKYHEHDSLLENKIDEGLTEEERQTAWQQYEQESQKLKSEEELRKKMLEQAIAAQSAYRTALELQALIPDPNRNTNIETSQFSNGSPAAGTPIIADNIHLPTYMGHKLQEKDHYNQI